MVRVRVDRVRLLPGARELLQHLSSLETPWAVATSGLLESARPTLDLLEVPADVPVITRDEVARAKPDPDLFLVAAERLGVDITDAVVVGDSVWDLLAARRAPTGCTRIRPICWRTSTSWGCEPRTSQPPDERPSSPGSDRGFPAHERSRRQRDLPAVVDLRRGKVAAPRRCDISHFKRLVYFNGFVRPP